MTTQLSLFRKLEHLLKGMIYLFFATVFFTNHPTLAMIADEIRDEIIIPIQQSYFLELSENGYEPPLIPALPDEITPSEEITPTAAEKQELTEGNKIIIRYITPPPPAVTVSEDELWTAITAYRRDHGKSDLNRSDSLCKYARRRADELYNRYLANPEDPLDNHAGFQRDADSGYLFESTGFSHVGENLAFTPGYATATQIIEWAWDTSPGHRSLQLSDEVTQACLTGKHPIYVGMYWY